MNSLLLAAIACVGYLIAYHSYGRFLARRIFRINPDTVCPSEALRDDTDYVPTKKEVLFGHHFTSIAGLGPIVGPAVAIIWGWVPAMIWIFFGSIFMGAVHDFGSLMMSLRGEGRSVGDLAADYIGARVRILFLLIIFFLLWLVIAVFALIIAMLFEMYPAAVLPVWGQIPVALGLGYLMYHKGFDAAKSAVVAVLILYALIICGAYYPLTLPPLWGSNPLVLWIGILMVYTYVASILPVQTLLQPRDYLNSYQLILAMGLIVIGVLVAQPEIVAPAFNPSPEGAPLLIPFLFVIIACGAISGFHCMVSSGTTSKQCRSEADALWLGYGSMLSEGALATLVIISIGAGIGLGLSTDDGTLLTGSAAFSAHYKSWAAASGLGSKLGAFVMGSANLLNSYGISMEIAQAIIGVFIVSFAATTLDSAARIQRYVVSELAGACKIPIFTKAHPATMLVIGSALLLAFSAEGGKGALSLWPLFGTVNQLLAGLALLVISIYLAKQKTAIRYTFIPMLFILGMTGWAMLLNLEDFFSQEKWLLLSIGLAVLLLELWMIIESVVVLKVAYSKTRFLPVADTA